MRISVFMKACLMLPLFVFGQLSATQSSSEYSQSSCEMEPTPLEDLMSEHGILNRVMLIYEEIIRRLNNNQKFNPECLRKPAEIIRDLIEGHHEKLEEDYIFTKFEEAGLMLDLVKTLREQHILGRQLTHYIIENANEKGLKSQAQQLIMKQTLTDFITMYRPHEAREDTVLFPAFKQLCTPEEYEALGELFEEEEHRMFGEDPFDRFVEIIANVEKELGIYELAQFSPK